MRPQVGEHCVKVTKEENDHYMAPLHLCGNGHWIVNVFNCKETLDCKKKTSTSPNSRERLLIMKKGWCTTERENERERGREDAVFYEKEG